MMTDVLVTNLWFRATGKSRLDGSSSIIQDNGLVQEDRSSLASTSCTLSSCINGAHGRFVSSVRGRRQSGLEGKEFGISRVRMHHARAAMMNDDDDNEHRKPETAVRTSELINMMRYSSIRLSFDCF
jgi:hypothetical protein